MKRTLKLRSKSRRLFAVFAMVALAACGDEVNETLPVERPLPELLPLHAARSAAPGIFDTAGREVLLRGVNFNALGDYYQANEKYSPVIPLEDADFAEMARYGFNVVRLILSWSALEPQPGQISSAYLQQVRDAVATAKANGIYVVLDMHQDAWGKFIATPEGRPCPPGTERAIGWDGAPEWATLTGGKTTCRTPGVRELSPAVAQSFVNFYDDKDGIQTHLVDVWAALAREFAREPAVAGYDLLNEPHFGAALSGNAGKLAAYYTRAIDAIRPAERAAGGFAHIIFFEPVIVWPVVVDSIPAPDFTSDSNIVFAPHNYAESLTAFNSLTIEENFERAAADAATYGATFWVGEYGWFSDPPVNKQRLIRYANQEDLWRVGGVWWQWKQACGDPHSIGVPDGEPASELIHFHRSRCPGDVDLGVVPEWATVLSRPYPRAAPGRLQALTSDGDSATLRLSGVSPTAGELDLWIPSRGSRRATISGTGLGEIRRVGVDGGERALVSVSGSYEVRVD